MIVAVDMKSVTAATENLTVTLTLDNDEVLECAVLTIFSAGTEEYIALLPLDEARRHRRR